MLLRERVTTRICISLASAESLDEYDDWGVDITCFFESGGVLFQLMDADASVGGKQLLEELSYGDVGHARDVMADADEILPGNCVRYQGLDGH